MNYETRVGSQSLKASAPDMRREKCEGVKGHSKRSDRHEGLGRRSLKHVKTVINAC
jgi:hypothetical protein